ncbi:DeoR/GlpR family DNA-binding transcription regulator [Microlunatus speluncae]|uniref:DeoR/GlpR family DNA-binding transcription regulator n=1 Tax=Microlunatus speluncae TaxID=2594267 RepID=UPI00126644D6|nr:DeoR/GlpR family DNA-binding transcription regulator [Microlunatus speluncae]
MESSNRQEVILRGVREQGRVTVDDLARELACSTMTIRRDLDRLAGLGLLRRVHGGAVSGATAEETPYPVRSSTAVEAKQRIGEAAAKLISDGETVLIDGGTTALEVARRLRDRRLTVIPLGLHAATELRDTAGIRLIVPGGDVRPVEHAFVGPLTVYALGLLRFDTAVIGCCGIDATDGLTGHDLDESAVKTAAIAAARRTIVVADAAKWGAGAFTRFEDLSRVTTVITDDGAPTEQTDALAGRGIEVQRV